MAKQELAIEFRVRRVHADYCVSIFDTIAKAILPSILGAQYSERSPLLDKRPKEENIRDLDGWVIGDG